MADDIAFNKVLDLAPGVVEEVAPGVRRILANNPGPYTFKGTVSYIVGRGKVAIIDPGPAGAGERHVAALLDAVRGETVTHILITHTHRDHSAAAAPVKAATGAVTLGEGPHRPARPLFIGETAPLNAGGDSAFAPDRRLVHGDVVEGEGFALEAVATPGHTANHMAFALKGTGLLFSGDHVMGWSTLMVAPPDGAMGDYMASLHRLMARPESIYLPGHGDAIRDAPDTVAKYIRHRLGREASILSRLGKGDADIPSLVRAIYVGLDPRLAAAAALTVLAHLEDLVARGLVATDGASAIAGRYRLPG
jgi:glyoxylase-like metal-dependent hydrolase (beta-lactamase superfamily II)